MDSGETDGKPPKMAWRGNRKSTYAQEFHARERELSARFALTHAASSAQYKVTGSDECEKKKATICNAIGSQKSSPMCATWLRTEESDRLLYGDDEGVLHILTFADEWGGDDIKVSPGVSGHLLPGISEESPWAIHSTWVTKLKYLNHSSSLISSSMDGTLMMLDLEKQRKKWSIKEHQNGIFSLDYCRSFNFIVTCGLERHINVVNPFTAKLIGALHGHQSPVVDVVVNDKDQQIMSIASNNVIKIWDMRTYRCLQTVCEKFDEKSIEPPILCRLLYDRRRSVLLAGGSSISAFHQKGAHETKSSKICTALYNPIFNQVVIGKVDFMVTIWNLGDGSKVLSFSDEHRGTKISTMCFDSSGRRLLVAGQDGSLRMWNYNNGQCLKEFIDFGQVLFTSDSKGYVKAWGLKECKFTKESSKRDNILELFCFRAHCEAIVSISVEKQGNLKEKNNA